MKANKWLDELVDTAEKLRELAIDEKRYEAFSVSSRMEFQLSEEGFEHLAHDIGAVVTYNPNWYVAAPNTGEMHFIYRSYRFCALWEKKGEKK